MGGSRPGRAFKFQGSDDLNVFLMFLEITNLSEDLVC
jgi:hypothetical protein